MELAWLEAHHLSVSPSFEWVLWMRHRTKGFNMKLTLSLEPVRRVAYR